MGPKVNLLSGGSESLISLSCRATRLRCVSSDRIWRHLASKRSTSYHPIIIIIIVSERHSSLTRRLSNTRL